jgi:hypothetical protein
MGDGLSVNGMVGSVYKGAMDLGRQVLELFILAIPIACISRTIIFEEVFREPREWCRTRSKFCAGLLERKFFYLFTCEYCFSHYVTCIFLFITRYKLLFDDWRGYLISFFSLVFIANAYINLYGRLRIEITKEKALIKSIEEGDGKSVRKPEAKCPEHEAT